MTRERKNPDERRELILQAAVDVATEAGLSAVTRAAVADRAAVAPGLISHYFRDMANLRAEIMGHAIENRILAVIAQGVAAGDPIARAAPDDLKLEALATLA